MRKGRGRRVNSSRYPTMTAKCVRQIARMVDHHSMDIGSTGRVKPISTLSSILAEPKQTMTIRCYDFSAMDRDVTENSSAVSVRPGRVLSNFKDYAPAYFKPNSVTIISCRDMSGGQVTGGSITLGTMTNLGFNLLGNWLGVPILGTGLIAGTYGLIKCGTVELPDTANRQKITYYPLHWDQAIVWNASIIEILMWMVLTLCYFKLFLIGVFHRALTKEEKQLTNPNHQAQEVLDVKMEHAAVLEPKPKVRVQV